MESLQQKKHAWYYKVYTYVYIYVCACGVIYYLVNTIGSAEEKCTEPSQIIVPLLSHSVGQD